MGHIVNQDREYRLLQQRLDKMVTGAPDSPTFQKILRMVYSEEDASLARRIPTRPTPVPAVARKLGIPIEELDSKVRDMAGRGIVMDFERKGARYICLAPVVIGFFEFTFMRTRDELPMKELSHLFEQYMTEDDRFARSVFSGQTQIGRSLVHEEALPEDHTEILDWERASHIVKTATAHGVSLCACRHKATHLGRACGQPLETCMTFNFAAETMIRNGLAKRITAQEAMSLLEDCKQRGLAQTGDNVQRGVSYICNCCGCCCGMMEAIRTFDMKNAIVTSNWIAEIDTEACKGCGLCVQACPIQIVHLEERQNESGEILRKVAVRDEEVCLGCGVCATTCKVGAITMRSRPQRVCTPETAFDRIASMAIERGKLADLLFEDPEKLSHRTLGRLLGLLEKSPPFRAAMAVKPLKSAFLNALVSGAKRAAGDAASDMS